jgi:hypothetical protein
VRTLLGAALPAEGDAGHSAGLAGGSEASVPAPGGEDSADVLALLGAADPPAGDVANPAGLPGGSAAAVPVPGGHDSADVLAFFAVGGDRPEPGGGNADRADSAGNAADRGSGGTPDPWALAALPGGTAGDQPAPGDADGGGADVLAMLTQDAGSRVVSDSDPPPPARDGVLTLSGAAATPSPPVAAMQDPLAARGDPAPCAPPGGGWWTRGAARVPACVRAIPRLPSASDFVSLLEADA